MKKYVKPELFFEEFVLSQNIADCAFEFTNSESANACQAAVDPNKVPGMDGVVFAVANVCEGSEFSSYCETNSADGINTFKS